MLFRSEAKTGVGVWISLTMRNGPPVAPCCAHKIALTEKRFAKTEVSFWIRLMKRDGPPEAPLLQSPVVSYQGTHDMRFKPSRTSECLNADSCFKRVSWIMEHAHTVAMAQSSLSSLPLFSSC